MYSKDSVHSQIGALALSAILPGLIGIASFLAMRDQRRSVRLASAGFLSKFFMGVAAVLLHLLRITDRLLATPMGCQCAANTHGPMGAVKFTSPQKLSSDGQGALFRALAFLSRWMRLLAVAAPDRDP